MTAREHFDPSAGVWIAWYEGLNVRTGVPNRTYLRSGPFGLRHTSWTTTAADAIRFDTKAEAMLAMNTIRPGRMPAGYRKGASRITDETTA